MHNTTPKTIPLAAFSPPGPGEWRIIDHITHPGTRYFAEYYYAPMETGWNEEAELIGTLNRVRIREVNGFMYYQIGGVESEQQFRAMCQVNEGYWEEKRFLSRLQEWDEVVKPAAFGQLVAQQNITPCQLSQDGLIEHINDCFKLTRQMVRIHHFFTYTAFIPVGDFVRQVSMWTGRSAVEVLTALNSKNSSKPFVTHKARAVQALVEQLQSSTTALYLLSKVEREPENAGVILDELLARGGGFTQGLRHLLELYGYHIINGYDITANTFVERPDILLKMIKSILNTKHLDDHTGVQVLRDITPGKEKLLFDELLSDVYEMQRLRYERGMYSDLWAIGILRHAVLEAGRRLSQIGMIHSPELALDASPKELIELLRENPVVSSTELQQRADYRSLYSVADAPSVLGSPSANPPDLSCLPSPITRTMAGLMTAITLAVEHINHQAKQQDTYVGTPASKGIVEGYARVILSEDQLREIQRGDILVVHQTTASFNVIFPLIGGIISQFGGILSHPAILAREYSIPCVVGCSDIVEHLHTGMRIRLDGNAGEVMIIQESKGLTERLESLQCKYYGPMQGRNRDRVFNHLQSVSEKLSLIAEIRKNERCLDILHRHFYSVISADEAAEQIIAQLSGTSLGATRKSLEGFALRYHVELHPSDACQLNCSGCTYFQDTPSRPNAVSFPYESISKICSLFQPKAVTIVGGGEPTLYRSGQYKLGDLIYNLGQGEFGCTPAIGLISNGVQWVPGNQKWHHYVKWVRYSLDASTEDSYTRNKGKNYFNETVENVFRSLTETSIPQVGVGFLYHPGNIAEAGSLISLLAKRLERSCPDQLYRLNIQFRPWRMPIGRPSINERILSDEDIKQASASLLDIVEQDAYIEQFVRQNTNIAVNLLCGGARENIKPFSECYFGLAKTVVRADGSLYPCFRMAANRDPLFACGNILVDTPLSIMLKELYVILFSAQQICIPEYDKCLFCVFNNALEIGLTKMLQPRQELAGDYFF